MLTRRARYSLAQILICIVCCILHLTLSLNTEVNGEEQGEIEYYEGAPILDNKIIPGYILDKCEFCFLPVSNMRVNRDIKLSKNLEKTKRIKYEKEYWMTLTTDSLREERKKSKEAEVSYSVISVERYNFDTNADAKVFTEAYLNRYVREFTDGSYSGKSIGQHCWTNKDSYSAIENKRAWGYANGLVVIFLKNNVFVVVRGHSLPLAKGHPMPPQFVEDIAQKINEVL